MSDINKKDVIKLLETIAVYLELKAENSFKISAYQKAAMTLERDNRSLNEIEDMSELKGIGQKTASVIDAYIKHHESETLKQLEKEVPQGLIPLLDLPGLGGKKLAKLYQDLNITDAQTLKEAAESGEIERLDGFGKKTVNNILDALKASAKRPQRLGIAILLPIAEKIERYLDTLTNIITYSRAGSMRRMRETVKDIDYIIATTEPQAVHDALVKLPDAKEVIADGFLKVSVTIEDVYDINVDFRLVQSHTFGSALHHFTGSKDHNVAMRQLAKANGEKINEYGVEVEETGETLTFESETDFFNHFGLKYIPPEVRENYNETEIFTRSVDMVEDKHIRGDLHMHTTWSDGGQSVEEMVNKAREKGYEYIAITDHSKFLKVANGLNEKRLRDQRQEIDRLNDLYTDIHIFAGVEMDIRPNGTLDFDDELLKEMDVVIGAIHSAFGQSEADIMNRLYTAMNNPYVNWIAHPSGRLIGKRDGYQVDIARLIDHAAQTGTALELNANPNRLDLSSEWLYKAQSAGVPIVINTDAHSYPMLEHMQYGVGTAKKGWLTKDSVLNTWTLEKLKRFLAEQK